MSKTAEDQLGAKCVEIETQDKEVDRELVEAAVSEVLNVPGFSEKFRGVLQMGQYGALVEDIINNVHNQGYDLASLPMEVVQNSHTAKARRVRLVFSMQNFPIRSTLLDTLKVLQGPALHIFDDGGFTDIRR